MVDDKATTINALIEAVEAIEMEMGITPSGVYADVRVRLDILEARINNPFAPAPNVENPFYIGDGYGTSISTGTGVPTENRQPGSLYLRKDGYNDEGLYARRPDGNWHKIDTDPFTAAGDLSGNIYSQTVVGLQNRPFSATAPINTLAGDGYVISWNSGLSQWEPQAGFYAAGDLTGTKLNQTLVKLQGTSIVIGTMDAAKDGYVLTWNNGVTRWEPQRLAVVFDPLDSGVTTNLRSNRYSTQSPIDNTKIGIVNLSSDSVQLSAGATANYAAIVGGDQNTVAGDYSFIGDGYSNTIDALISSIVGGRFNSIIPGSDLSFIGGGNNNAISGDRSVIVGGDTNVIAGGQSAILAGVGNVVNGTRSVILLGNTNVIDVADSFIGVGLNNQITLGQYGTILTGNGNTVSGNYSTVLNGLTNTVVADHGFISAGFNNTVNGNQSSVLNGNHNTIATGHSYTTILNGDHNSITGDNNTLLNGSLNTVTASGVVTLGGISNTITSNRVLVFGNGNTLTTGSDFSTTFGAGNAVADGYSLVHGLLNTANAGSTYVNIYGNNNLVGSSTHVGVWGSSNTVVNTSSYSFIFGDSNTINTGSDHARVFGSSNIVGTSSPYALVAGTSNVIGNATTSSLTAGANIANSGSFSGAIGKRHSVSSVGVGAFVHGQFARAINAGQYSHANTTFTSNTPGSAQFARVIMTGSASSGAPIALTTDGSANLTMEDGYAYDMFVKMNVTQTSGPTGVAARYQFDILVHKEAGVVTIDRVNTYLVSDNGTGWVGNNWTSIFNAGSTTIAVASNGASLPQSTINVASTTGFPTTGTIYVLSSTGYQQVTYTGVTGTTFTGCTIAYSAAFGGSLGTLATGNTVYTLVGTTGNFFVNLPSGGIQSRRAVASVEWREITRL